MSLLRQLLRLYTHAEPSLPLLPSIFTTPPAFPSSSLKPLSWQHPPLSPALLSPLFERSPHRRESSSLHSAVWRIPNGAGSQTPRAQRNESELRLGQQQRRHIFLIPDNEDFEKTLRIYGSKLKATGLEKALKERQYYTKPSERRKLAKHYKKLNRAKRELAAKVRIVKGQMEYRRELRARRKMEKNES